MRQRFDEQRREDEEFWDRKKGIELEKIRQHERSRAEIERTVFFIHDCDRKLTSRSRRLKIQ